MALALREARLAAERGEVPIGAVIEVGGEVIGAAHNQVEGSDDPTAHAEMLALTQAGFARVDVRLTLAPAWTTDWMSEAAREKLRSSATARKIRRAVSSIIVCYYNVITITLTSSTPAGYKGRP